MTSLRKQQIMGNSTRITPPPNADCRRDGSHSSFLKFGAAVLLVLLLAAFCCVGAVSATAISLTDELVQSHEGNLPTGEYILNSDVTLTIKNIIIPLNSEVTIDLNGKTLTGNGNGKVITLNALPKTDQINKSAKLTIDDHSDTKTGKITGGNGGIKVSRGSYFYFNGGNITGNTATSGGGVEIVTNGNMVMNGGVITGNTATGSESDDEGGGGLKIGNGYFTMTGGEITDNHAPSGKGGGIYFCGNDYQELHLAGGKITGNSAKTGGGVYLRSNAYVMYLKGTLNITGNTNSDSSTETEENIRFDSRKQYFVLDGNLDSSSVVGFTVAGCHRFLNGGTYTFNQASVKIDNIDKNTQRVITRDSNMFVEPSVPVPADAGYFSAKVNGEKIYYTTLEDAFYDLPVDDNTIYCEKDATISTTASLQVFGSAVLTAEHAVTIACSDALFSNSGSKGNSLTITGPIVFDGNNADIPFIIQCNVDSIVNIGTKDQTSGYPIIRHFRGYGDKSVISISAYPQVLNLYDCTIEENYAGGNKGLIFLTQGGTINQFDGCLIKNNTGGSNRPIIDLAGDGTVYNMYGGTIEDNKHTGTITSTILFANNKVTFNQYGGEIKNNTGLSSVCLDKSNGVYNLFGGFITGNKGTNGGIYVSEGTFSISGNPVIKDNTNANVNLANSKTITLAGELISGADIRVTSSGDDIAVGSDTYSLSESDLQYFTPDDHTTAAFYYDSEEHKIMKGSPSVAITLHSNNGKDPEETDTQYVVADKATPLKDIGFTFEKWDKKGWNTAADGSGDAYDIGEKVTIDSPLTLYAQWTANIVLDKNGDGTDGSIKVTYNNASLSDYTAATNEGYNLEGYYSQATGESLIINISNPANPTLEKNVDGFTDAYGKWINTDGSSLKLYANWTAKTYTVTFDKNGGDTDADPKSIKETYDSNYVLPTTAPTKEGYDFADWYTAADGGNKVTADTVVKTASDHTIYAHWTRYKYVVEVQNHVADFSELGLPVVKVDVGQNAITKVKFKFMDTQASISTKPAGFKSITPIKDEFDLDIEGEQTGDVTVYFNADGTGTIFLAHQKGTVWEFLKAELVSGTQYKAVVTKESGFSPFQIVSAEPEEVPPSHSSSSSRNDGYSTWLPATAEPTPTPAAEEPQPTQGVPSVSPVNPTQAPATPAPFVGLLAGLGAAAVLFGLRRK